MPQIHTQEAAGSARAALFSSQARPAISKMVTNYLAEIERMLDAHDWDGAIRESLDLPQIAVALADRHLCSCDERVQQWCFDWIRPLHADGEAHAVDPETVCRQLLQAKPRLTAEGVPATALRRLRLRRLGRTPHSGFSTEHVHAEGVEGRKSLGFCMMVVEAVRRWYAIEASRDPVVQANLGRLAILR